MHACMYDAYVLVTPAFTSLVIQFHTLLKHTLCMYVCINGVYVCINGMYSWYVLMVCINGM